MKHVKTILLFAFLIIGLQSFGQTKQLPPIIDRELFFGDPEITGAQLSPDGKYISFIKAYKGTRNIWVKRADAAFANAKPITEDTLRPIRNYFWSKDSKYVLYSQ